ncbi:MAG: DUF6320 domain-containing protein [Lachnospiraceae bacterium]
MSYCVNCGVELEATCSVCPLCHTKVYNPHQPPADDIPTPYPRVKGTSEAVSHREFTILMTIIFLTTSVVCGFLNIFTFPYGKWSLYVIGVCFMMWVFLIPFFFPERNNLFLSLTLDGISIALYFGFISLLHPGRGWYLHLALPIVALSTLLIELFVRFALRRKSSMIAKTILIVTEIAALCFAVELLIDYHLGGALHPTWSVIVLTCCIAIDIILFTISMQKGIRNEIRRRMHF